MSETLEPCWFDHDYSPTDGSDPDVLEYRGIDNDWDEPFYYVWCSCGARGPLMPDESMARTAWNRRCHHVLAELATILGPAFGVNPYYVDLPSLARRLVSERRRAPSPREAALVEAARLALSYIDDGDLDALTQEAVKVLRAALAAYKEEDADGLG